MAPPPAFMDELIEEFLLRLPPDDPASLVRAALVCKPWGRLLSCPRFRRRYREHHRTPPLLGFVETVCGSKSNSTYRVHFFSTSSFRLPHAQLHGWMAIHSCHGRVLCCPPPWGDKTGQKRLLVWNLMTAEQRELPRLPWCPFPGASWNAAVLCASSVGAGCSNLDCHRGPFLVVFVGTLHHKIVASVYSSETDAWGEPTFAWGEPTFRQDYYPQFCSLTGALVRNALYFTNSEHTKLLKYDMTTREASAINLPPQASARYFVLMAMEDGRLGLAIMQKSKLYLWSREDGQDGDARWEQSRVIELDALLPIEALSTEPHIVGCADSFGDIFLWTRVGIFYVGLKSRRVKKLGRRGPWFGNFIVPELLHSSLGSGSGASSA